MDKFIMGSDGLTLIIISSLSDIHVVRIRVDGTEQFCLRADAINDNYYKLYYYDTKEDAIRALSEIATYIRSASVACISIDKQGGVSATHFID